MTMNKPLAPTPPMGWNSWNTFSWNIHADLIKTSADAMVESGLIGTLLEVETEGSTTLRIVVE